MFYCVVKKAKEHFKVKRGNKQKEEVTKENYIKIKEDRKIKSNQIESKSIRKKSFKRKSNQEDELNHPKELERATKREEEKLIEKSKKTSKTKSKSPPKNTKLSIPSKSHHLQNLPLNSQKSSDQLLEAYEALLNQNQLLKEQNKLL